MDIKCFIIAPTGNCRRSLRRYAGNTECGGSYHDATVYLDVVPGGTEGMHELPHSDPRWDATKHCQKCGYEFQPKDEWQVFCEAEYARDDNGERCTLRNAPVGAMWFADWMDGKSGGWNYHGPDGRCLLVQTPGGSWMVDARAKNCTMPDDNSHKCWVRHGTAPLITVDKNGHTCAAGAGSIQCGSYHGFLRNGYLTDC